MSGLTDSQGGVLLSSMSDASCGMTLGRSVGWVVRMRRDLLADEMPTEGEGAPWPAQSVGAGAAAPPPTSAAPAPPEASAVRPAPKPEARSPGVCHMLTEVNRLRIKALREEFDLLCLPPPSEYRIARLLSEGAA